MRHNLIHHPPQPSLFRCNRNPQSSEQCRIYSEAVCRKCLPDSGYHPNKHRHQVISRAISGEFGTRTLIPTLTSEEDRGHNNQFPKNPTQDLNLDHSAECFLHQRRPNSAPEGRSPDNYHRQECYKLHQLGILTR